MKTSPWAAKAAAILMGGVFATPSASAQTSPTIPVGSLSAFPTVVQTGTKPTLTWSINYPSIVENYVTVTPPGTVTPKQNLICEIRILGLGVTSYSNGQITYYRTRGRMRYNGSTSWTTVYDGKQTDTIVQQQGIVKSAFTVNANKPMNFAGQYYNNGAWQTEYTTLNGDNVRTLVNGATCPGNIPDYNAPSLEQFLKPYLDSSKKVRIGPMDVIVFMELTHGPTQKSNVGYDLQDLAMLLTYRTP